MEAGTGFGDFWLWGETFRSDEDLGDTSPLDAEETKVEEADAREV